MKLLTPLSLKCLTVMKKGYSRAYCKLVNLYFTYLYALTVSIYVQSKYRSIDYHSLKKGDRRIAP